MKKVEKETQAFREVPLPQEVNGEEQIHYLPVKILPNGQMVVLAPLNQGLPEVS